ncbi:diaminopimelate epimerase [Rubrivivax benzoatilyticus]|uniref:Diaminopimelate epimerase n=1 Tax=Rubrivivax benzoatilyticus TaxID=316997 RepID=A0ABX0HWE3_9BURK|nr:diaminopimelate epimerase [Rubrivivax benzoatilyticus]EGJ12190.1 diaminopimelate epimerase [Rubrivivax benzoatilyticus JA2 = ATCC BAA-35]NHK99335.1 diaminopimelate epimerase [Rubrivivax benzoatilyticus]NHL25209.1 diaminopimelate epimerase [Rubrivivax benzoatilyticus]
MRLRFTKMHGAGNDFVVLDATGAPLALSREQIRRLGDRRFGVGADQILVIERSTTPGVDFRYRIFNNTGDEVEQCGNGSRCFVRYVVDHGLTDKTTIRVETVNNLLELSLAADGRVRVDMNRPVFDLARVPFDASGLTPRLVNGFELWPLADAGVEVAVLSMGNPHAVMRVADVDAAPVAAVGPRVESHARFPRRVNAGFLQVLSRSEVKLRVYERDAGETLACGTGACAAVVAGIRLGWLDRRVEVHARGGDLLIEWPDDSASVLMTGPAVTVFEGEIEL